MREIKFRAYNRDQKKFFFWDIKQGFGGKEDIAIVYGDTLQDIQAVLEKEFGPMPKSKPLAERH